MKTIGIIGGLSPESTMLYYQGLNDGVCTRLGGHHNAKIIINSLDFGEFTALKDRGDWGMMSNLLCKAAASLERAGADGVILATNTMHKMAGQIIDAINIPFIHLADATADEILRQEIKTIGLLGTRYTMEMDFYKGRLEDRGIRVLVPDAQGRTDVHDIIYDELCQGTVKDQSRIRYQNIITDLENQGAGGIILGCTEIGMLISPDDVSIKCFDTTQIHVQTALDFIFKE